MAPVAAFKDKVAAIWFGRDFSSYMKRSTLSILVIPRRDLTGEGEMILAGLRIEMTFVVPLVRGHGGRQSALNRDDYRWRSPLRLQITSDAGKIAALSAARAQCLS